MCLRKATTINKRAQKAWQYKTMWLKKIYDNHRGCSRHVSLFGSFSFQDRPIQWVLARTLFSFADVTLPLAALPIQKEHRTTINQLKQTQSLLLKVQSHVKFIQGTDMNAQLEFERNLGFIVTVHPRRRRTGLYTSVAGWSNCVHLTQILQEEELRLTSVEHTWKLSCFLGLCIRVGATFRAEGERWLLPRNTRNSHPLTSRRLSNLLRKEMFVYRRVLSVGNGTGANKVLVLL